MLTVELAVAHVRLLLRAHARPMRIIDLYPYEEPACAGYRQAIFRLVLGKGDPADYGLRYNHILQTLSLA